MIPNLDISVGILHTILSPSPPRGSRRVTVRSCRYEGCGHGEAGTAFFAGCAAFGVSILRQEDNTPLLPLLLPFPADTVVLESPCPRCPSGKSCSPPCSAFARSMGQGATPLHPSDGRPGNGRLLPPLLPRPGSLPAAPAARQIPAGRQLRDDGATRAPALVEFLEEPAHAPHHPPLTAPSARSTRPVETWIGAMGRGFLTGPDVKFEISVPWWLGEFRDALSIDLGLCGRYYGRGGFTNVRAFALLEIGAGDPNLAIEVRLPASPAELCREQPTAQGDSGTPRTRSGLPSGGLPFPPR